MRKRNKDFGKNSNIVELPIQQGVDLNILLDLFKQFGQPVPLRAVALIGVERDMTVNFITSGRHGDKLTLIGALDGVRFQLLSEVTEVNI